MTMWFRMLHVILRLAGSNLFTPWRSPLIRWRMETYGIRGADGHLLHAEEITPGQFFRFILQHRIPLVRFLRWAAVL